MRILHTADLHLGQVIYQSYSRHDEHQHFFEQLTKWCKEYKPDALLVSGDVFDIQQPSASVKKMFNDYFVNLHRDCPEMEIVITAGNHDSAARLQADQEIWKCANTTMIGLAPSLDSDAGWENEYIVRLQSGYVIACPFMQVVRQDVLQHLLSVVNEENVEQKPVVLMGHAAVSGLDAEGHDFEVGKIKMQEVSIFGNGYDYLALGHIHKPQTIGVLSNEMRFPQSVVTYQSPVVRYAGSALHVSCDEMYPHSVSLVDIDKHNGNVMIKPLRINELRHFYVLPTDGSAFMSAQDAIDEVKKFCDTQKSGYIRLRVDYSTDLPANFNQSIYEQTALTNDEVRYNPKIIWVGEPVKSEDAPEIAQFDVSDLQELSPREFVEKTIDQYQNIDINEISSIFEEVEAEIHRLEKEEQEKMKTKATKENKNTVTEE